MDHCFFLKKVTPIRGDFNSMADWNLEKLADYFKRLITNSD